MALSLLTGLTVVLLSLGRWCCRAWRRRAGVRPSSARDAVATPAWLSVWPVLFGLFASLVALGTCAFSQAARALPPAVLAGPVMVELQIQTTAKRVKSNQPWQSGQRTFRAQVLAAGTTTLSVPVIVIGDARWAGIPIGSRVATFGEVTPSTGSQIVPLLRAKSAPKLVAEPGWVQARLNPFRQGLDAALGGQHSAGASLVAGLAVGDESGQSVTLATNMQASGLSHLTAVSGGNTAIVLILVLGVLRLRRVGIGGQVLVGLGSLALYCLLVGPQPSVLRAGAMGAVAMVGLARGGFRAGLPVLFLAAWLLLLLDPGLALSLGFGLSVLATAGLLALASRWHRRAVAWRWLRFVPRWLILAVVVTVAAQIATAPLLLLAGNQVSVIAVPANLLVAPLVAPITVLGLLATVLGPFLPTLAAFVATPATWLGSWIDAVANWGVAMQWAVVSWIWVIPVGVIGVLGLALGLTLHLRADVTRRFGRSARLRWGWPMARFGTSGLFPKSGTDAATQARSILSRVLIAVAAAGILAGLSVVVVSVRSGSMVADQPPWRAIACDVGQGSATVLRAEATVVLVDVGPVDGNVLDCLRAAEVESLSAVFLTHLHQDHVGGLASVLAEIPTQAVFATAAHLDPAGLDVIAKEHRPQLLRRGDQLATGDMVADVLWPLAAPVADNKNNGSLVIEFTWPDGTAAMTTGDIEQETQQNITTIDHQRPVMFATVPHHGSADMSPRFPTWLAARVAVVSSGIDNEYGHPSAESLAGFAQASEAVVRTDQSGTVAVGWDSDRASWWSL